MKIMYLEKGSPKMTGDPVKNRRIWNQIIVETIWENLEKGVNIARTGCAEKGLYPYKPTCDTEYISGKIVCNRCFLETFFQRGE